jgi:hypothetical protein
MKKTYPFKITETEKTTPSEEEATTSYFLARLRLIFAYDPAEVARLEKFTGLTQTEMVDLYIEGPSDLQLQTDELQPFIGHRGTHAERLKALRRAIEHLPRLYRDPDWDDSVTALLLLMVLQHCGDFRNIGDTTEHFLDSGPITINAAAMNSLAEEGLIEITEEHRHNIIAKVTTQGWLLVQR